VQSLVTPLHCLVWRCLSGEIKEIRKRYPSFASILEPITLHQYVVIRTGRLNPLNLSGYCMNHVERLKNLHSAYLVLLCVLYGSYNKQCLDLEHYAIVITEMEYIYCALRSEPINTIRVILSLETVNFSESVSGKLVTCYRINSMHRIWKCTAVGLFVGAC